MQSFFKYFYVLFYCRKKHWASRIVSFFSSSSSGNSDDHYPAWCRTLEFLQIPSYIYASVISFMVFVACVRASLLHI